MADAKQRTPLQRASGVADFLRAPAGRYLASDHFVVWCPGSDTCGTTFWDRPAESEIRTLVEVYDVARRPGMAPPIATVMDGGGLTGVDPLAYELLLRNVRKFRGELPELVRGQAVILPHGLLGATMAGFYLLSSVPYRFRMVESLEEALTWLGLADAAACSSEIERLVATLRGVPTMLASLRSLLRRERSGVTLASAAADLGISTRSLQRRLGDAGTSFRAELLASRVRAATALVANSNHKIETVARLVGVASPSHLSRAVRQATGVSLGGHRR